MSELCNHTNFQKAFIDVISKNTFDFIGVVRDEDRKIVFVNEMGAQLFNYENSFALINTFAPSLWKRKPGVRKFKEIDKEIALKGFFSAEDEFITNNGKVFWGRMQRTPFSADGIIYHLVQIEKIDRAKHAEENLLKEKQRFGALMDYASIGVIIANPQEQIILMNSFALQLFGYTMGELKGMNIEILIPSRFHEKHRMHQHRFYDNRKNQPRSLGINLYGIKKDGTEFPVEVSLGTYKTKNETYVIAFITDISIRKKAEQEITKLNANLERKVKERTDELAVTISKLEQQIKETEEAEKELMQLMQFQKAVLDSSGAMIIATDPHGVITLFNPEAEKLLGYKAAEVIGKFDPAFLHLEEETQQRALEFSKELKKNVDPGFETFVAKSRLNLANKHEWFYVKKNGAQFPVSLTVTALRNEQNVITGFLGVAVDISEIKKTEEELKKALGKEKELSELKSRFVSIASHEFRTPLSTVLSSTYLLQKYKDTEEHLKREKHIERIVSSVNILTDILNDFLSVGKIEEGKLEPKFSRFNIREHIDGVINEVKSLQKKGQQIIYQHDGEDTVMLDPSLLMHIVMNLLSNALKFSPEHSSIFINTEVTDSLLQLWIKDQGIGISRKDQRHLFERFFRGANVTGIQGTGLGLHIVQKYTEMMNGSVECVSEAEKGTEFILKIKMNYN